MKMEPTQFNEMAKLWAARGALSRTQSGIPVSELFPRVAKNVDDLCVIRSMTSNFSEHTSANYFLHTGLGLSGRPSMGAGFVMGWAAKTRICRALWFSTAGWSPRADWENFGSGFLPATFQGSIFRAGEHPMANLDPSEEPLNYSAANWP